MSALETFKAGELFQVAFIVRDLDAALKPGRPAAHADADPEFIWGA